MEDSHRTQLIHLSAPCWWDSYRSILIAWFFYRVSPFYYIHTWSNLILFLAKAPLSMLNVYITATILHKCLLLYPLNMSMPAKYVTYLHAYHMPDIWFKYHLSTIWNIGYIYYYLDVKRQDNTCIRLIDYTTTCTPWKIVEDTIRTFVCTKLMWLISKHTYCLIFLPSITFLLYPYLEYLNTLSSEIPIFKA